MAINYNNAIYSNGLQNPLRINQYGSTAGAPQWLLPAGYQNTGSQYGTAGNPNAWAYSGGFNGGAVSGSGSGGGSGGNNYQQQMLNWAKNAVEQMTGAQEQANTEMRTRQDTAENLFSGLMEQYQNDPLFASLRSGAENWLNNPGISDEVRKRLEAQTLARSAADSSAAMTSARRAAASMGMSGGLATSLQQQARSSGAANANNNLTNLSWQIEQQRMQDQQNALAYGGSLMNNYYSGLAGMGGQYANVLSQWQPQAAGLDAYGLMMNVYGLLANQ